MASATEIAKGLPDTLPEDFNEWDGRMQPRPAPAVEPNSSKAAPKPAAAPKQYTQPAKPRVIAPRAAEAPRNTPKPAPAKVVHDDEALFQSIRSSAANTQIPKRKARKITIAVIASSVLILASLIPLYHFGLIPGLNSMNRNVAPQATAAATDTQAGTNAPKPSAATQLTTTAAATTDTEQAADADTDSAPNASSKMMNAQLTTPARIPHDIKIANGKEAPPSEFGANSMEGLGGNGSAIGNVFSGQGGPKVKAAPAQKVNISAGVAVGLLIKKTAPAYPAIAKIAHTSGTVVMQATISKTGTIQNLRVVSGPAMLQQSAADAVRTWRYKPYMLNNQPVEVETTINVTFNLGG